MLKIDRGRLDVGAATFIEAPNTPRGFRVEIHDPTTQALIDVLEQAYAVGYEKAANQSPIGWFSLPRDDPKWSSVAAFREVWLYDFSGGLVDVFRIMPFKELHDKDLQEAKVQLEGYATVLQDDLVSAEVIWTSQTVTQILTDILAYQTVPRVNLGTIDGALNVTVTGYRVSYDNVMKACWDLRNVVGGYISVDPVADAPGTRQLNLVANPGQDIGQRIWKGLNLRALGKATDPTEAVTKLYPLGRGEGNNQQRPSSDLLTAQPATLANAGIGGQRATLTLTDLYSRYKGWTAAGAALPTGSSAFDTRSRPLKVFFGATDDTTNWEQGASDRVLRSTTNNYTPPAGAPTLNYVHADFLIADDTVATYGTIARPYPDKRFESSLDLVRASRATLDVVKQPRVSYDVKVADIVRSLRFGDGLVTLEDLNLYDQVNVVDDVLGIATKLRIVRVRYGDLWDPESFEITVGLLDSQPTDVRLQDRARQYAQMPDGATNIWVDSFEDNLDATHPYARDIYIPPDAVSVNKLTLNVRTKAYRYYVTTATAASGGGTPTSSGGGGTPTSSSGGGTHAHGLTSEGGNTAAASTDLHFHNYAATGITVGSQTSSGASVAHTHTVDVSHTHTVDVSHTHSVTVNPGIVESTTPSTMQVKVDGNVASASATSLTDFDLTPYLTKDSSGKIVRGWHTLTFTPDVAGRIQAAVVEVVFIQSRGVVAG